jgi:hypothetical protein
LNAVTSTYTDYFKNTGVTQIPYAATFMDYIKRDTSLFDPMHFIDYPYKEDGDFEAPAPDNVNAVNALYETSKTLIFKGNSSLAWSKGFSLLLMLHVLGDMHQPLHAVTMFSESKHLLPPVGDMGGNLYTLNYTSEFGKTYTQMHLLYDCVGGLWCEYMPHPVTHDFDDLIQTEADKLMEEYSKESLIDEGYDLEPNFKNAYDFKDHMTAWAKESFDLAVDSYNSIEMDSTPDATQIAWIRAMLKKRIAIAGYRTGHIMQLVDTDVIGYDGHSVPASWRTATIIAFMLLLIAVVMLFVSYRKNKSLEENYKMNDFTALNP